MNSIGFILSPLIALIVGLFFLGVSRKIMARIHWRYGPPITQPLIDIIRQFSQKGMSHGTLFTFGIILSLAGSLVLVLFIPVGKLCPLCHSGGMLVILYLMLLAPLGIALSGGEAANPNASIGISRKLLLALGYEIPLILILLAVMTQYRSISLAQIVAQQQAAGWNLFSLPMLLPGLAYILILPAVLGVRPFELVQANQEISSGPMVEFGGPFLALATLQHAVSEFVGIALFVNLFLGGAQNALFFCLKMMVVLLVGLFINAAFPRLRIEQAIRYLWRWPTLLALAGVIVVMIIGG